MTEIDEDAELTVMEAYADLVLSVTETAVNVTVAGDGTEAGAL